MFQAELKRKICNQNSFCKFTTNLLSTVQARKLKLLSKFLKTKGEEYTGIELDLNKDLDGNNNIVVAEEL